MRIAILGGGGAGLTTAWLLQHQHQVEVFEKEPILGGHVCTLNRNVACGKLSKDVFIENGVLGFHNESYPNFIRLMKKLQVPLLADQPTARLYNGQSQYPVTLKEFFSNIKASNIGAKFRDALTLMRMGRAFKKFNSALDATNSNTSPNARTGPLLSPEKMFGTMQRALLMLSFSTPYSDTDDLPAGLSLPFMISLRQKDWSYVEGGVYHYMEILLKDFRGTVHTNVQVTKVMRTDTGVELLFQNGDRRAFDKVVFATSPGQILGLLDKPSEAELRCFSPWKDKPFVTIAHTDEIYKGYANVPRTPMDFFVDDKQGIAGYNTSMNSAYRLSGETPYAFAYNLEKLVRPETILDKQTHMIPGYNEEAFKTRPEIKEMNGTNHCYYAGAWLGNGLHEGAVSSAVEVAGRLGIPWS